MVRYVLFNTGIREVKLRMTIEHTVIIERYKQITPYSLINNIYENTIDEETSMYILKEALAPYTNGYNSLESVSELVDEYFDHGGSWWTLNTLILTVFQEAGFYDSPSNDANEIKDDSISSDEITMEKLAKSMLTACLEAGLSEDSFWNMTYREIVGYMTAYRKRKEAEFKESIKINHLLGDLIGTSVSRIFSKEVKYPSVVELFPELYEEESKLLEKQKEQELNERIKANMMAFGMAYKNNKEVKEVLTKDEFK